MSWVCKGTIAEYSLELILASRYWMHSQRGFVKSSMMEVSDSVGEYGSGLLFRYDYDALQQCIVAELDVCNRALFVIYG